MSCFCGADPVGLADHARVGRGSLVASHCANPSVTKLPALINERTALSVRVAIAQHVLNVTSSDELRGIRRFYSDPLDVGPEAHGSICTAGPFGA